MKKAFFALLLLSPLFFSCKKENKSCDLNSGNFAGSYKIISEISKEEGMPEVNELAALPACRQDDIIVFSSNNVSSVTDAGTQCSPIFSFSDTWTLSGNTVTNGNGSTGVVTAFDCNGMTIVSVYGATTLTTVYARQ